MRVRDVADVHFGYARDRTTVFRLHGKNSQAIAVTKRAGSNIVDLVDEAKRTVEELRPTWPAGTNVNYTFDQSIAIRRMAKELQNHILTGLVLVVLILSFFLGVRNSFFISTAIPFSMMMGFLVLDYMGITLNMVVLFSLVIGLGMLVDDGIVVVENIYRHLQMGKTKVQAAIDGTKEVMLPVATATLTTIFAFLPLLMMPGMMGQFFKFLPITVSVTLAGSLFVAFVFNPVFASLFMNKNEKGLEEGGGEGFEKVKRWYSGVLDRSVRHPILVTLFCIAFVVGGIMAYGAFGTGVVFFPKIDPLVVAVEIEGPLGISINETDSALKIIEKKLFTMPKDSADVESYSAVVGFGKTEMGRRPQSGIPQGLRGRGLRGLQRAQGLVLAVHGLDAEEHEGHPARMERERKAAAGRPAPGLSRLLRNRGRGLRRDQQDCGESQEGTGHHSRPDQHRLGLRTRASRAQGRHRPRAGHGHGRDHRRRGHGRARFHPRHRSRQVPPGQGRIQRDDPPGSQDPRSLLRPRPDHRAPRRRPNPPDLHGPHHPGRQPGQDQPRERRPHHPGMGRNEARRQGRIQGQGGRRRSSSRRSTCPPATASRPAAATASRRRPPHSSCRPSSSPCPWCS